MSNRSTSSRRKQRREITVGPEIASLVDESQDALLESERVHLYQHGGTLVEITDGAQMHRVSPVRLRELLDRVATYVKQTANGEPSQIKVPHVIGATLLARSHWPFPILDGITGTPIFRADGTILASPGYDAETRYLYMSSIEFPTPPDRPREQHVQAALDTLLDPFRDFPFVAEWHRAAAIAAVLSLLGRPAIKGPVPLYGVTSTAPGSGKGFLVDVVALIGTGAVAPRESATHSDEEMRKRILAIGMQGQPLVLLDNVEGALGTPSLANALTAPSFSDRLLGTNNMATTPLRAVWFATGNGLSYRGDLGRRVIPIELDARCEHPEDRTGFHHPDLLAYVREHRARLVCAGLTLLRAFTVAGRPRHGKPPVGSFESWDDLVRGACIWAGLSDPAQGRDEIRAQGDADLDALRSLMEAWEGCIGPTPETLADLKRRAQESESLRAAWLEITNRDQLNTRALGYALRRYRGRPVDGRMFQCEGKTGGAGRWRLVSVARDTGAISDVVLAS